jgi:hypothetical protein
MMRIGTANFVSKVHAIKYYRDFAGYCSIVDARDAVVSKLASGEIHIGKPALKSGEKLNVIDGGTRYEIEEAPCDHNEMVPNDSPTHIWKCAKCGHVYNGKIEDNE